MVFDQLLYTMVFLKLEKIVISEYNLSKFNSLLTTTIRFSFSDLFFVLKSINFPFVQVFWRFLIALRSKEMNKSTCIHRTYLILVNTNPWRAFIWWLYSNFSCTFNFKCFYFYLDRD